MKLSQAGLYALHGLVFLAGRPAGAFVPLSAICARTGLPRTHLAIIFQTLAGAGLLKSVRGVSGGFSLARPSRAISAFEVISLFDGTGIREGCPVHPKHRSAGRCCAFAKLVTEARSAMADLFKRATLADLAASDPGGALAGTIRRGRGPDNSHRMRSRTFSRRSK